MRKMLAGLTAFVLVLCLHSASADTPPGFGYINTNRTNVRESAGGPIVTQLNDGDAVYILAQLEDSQGRLWYHVNTEHQNDRPITVWVQARYITAGSALFHDVVQVAAGEMGMLALQSGGTVVGVANENIGTRVFRKTIAQWKNVKQVACGFMTYIALCEDGSLRGFGNMAYEDWDRIQGVRLLDGKDMNIAFVTADGVCNQETYNLCYTLVEPLDWQRAKQIVASRYGVIARYPEGTITCVFYETVRLPTEYHGIAGWNDLTALECGDWFQLMQGTDTFKLRPLFVGLHADGTVSTMPEDLIPAVEAWTDITDVRAGWKFIIGLRADGTAVAAGGEEYGIPGQVAQWTDVVAIDACTRYCVGLKADGTLVFAGEYTF